MFEPVIDIGQCGKEKGRGPPDNIEAKSSWRLEKPSRKAALQLDQTRRLHHDSPAKVHNGEGRRCD